MCVSIFSMQCHVNTHFNLYVHWLKFPSLIWQLLFWFIFPYNAFISINTVYMCMGLGFHHQLALSLIYSSPFQLLLMIMYGPNQCMSIFWYKSDISTLLWYSLFFHTVMKYAHPLWFILSLIDVCSCLLYFHFDSYSHVFTSQIYYYLTHISWPMADICFLALLWLIYVDICFIC